MFIAQVRNTCRISEVDVHGISFRTITLDSNESSVFFHFMTKAVHSASLKLFSSLTKMYIYDMTVANSQVLYRLLADYK